jgi:hypothetical protein
MASFPSAIDREKRKLLTNYLDIANAMVTIIPHPELTIPIEEIANKQQGSLVSDPLTLNLQLSNRHVSPPKLGPNHINAVLTFNGIVGDYIIPWGCIFVIQWHSKTQKDDEEIEKAISEGQPSMGVFTDGLTADQWKRYITPFGPAFHKLLEEGYENAQHSLLWYEETPESVEGR